jgi:hypothetical protein
MSLATQSMASGNRARSRRRTALATTSGGEVSHTIPSIGRILRSERRRSRHVAGLSRRAWGGCIGFSVSMQGAAK